MEYINGKISALKTTIILKDPDWKIKKKLINKIKLNNVYNFVFLVIGLTFYLTKYVKEGWLLRRQPKIFFLHSFIFSLSADLNTPHTTFQLKFQFLSLVFHFNFSWRNPLQSIETSSQLFLMTYLGRSTTVDLKEWKHSSIWAFLRISTGSSKLRYIYQVSLMIHLLNIC